MVANAETRPPAFRSAGKACTAGVHGLRSGSAAAATCQPFPYRDRSSESHCNWTASIGKRL